MPAAQPQLHNKLQSQQRRYIICVWDSPIFNVFDSWCMQLPIFGDPISKAKFVARVELTWLHLHLQCLTCQNQYRLTFFVDPVCHDGNCPACGCQQLMGSCLAHLEKPLRIRRGVWDGTGALLMTCSWSLFSSLPRCLRSLSRATIIEIYILKLYAVFWPRIPSPTAFKALQSRELHRWAWGAWARAAPGTLGCGEEKLCSEKCRSQLGVQ